MTNQGNQRDRPPTDPSNARARIASIQWWVEGGCGANNAEARFLLDRIAELEKEACIKDAYAYELAKERDALDTQLGDALERLALLEKG